MPGIVVEEQTHIKDNHGKAFEDEGAKDRESPEAAGVELGDQDSDCSDYFCGDHRIELASVVSVHEALDAGDGEASEVEGWQLGNPGKQSSEKYLASFS